MGVEHNESVKLILRTLTKMPEPGTQMATYQTILATRYDEEYLTGLASLPEQHTYEYVWEQIGKQCSATFVSDLRAVEQYLQTERSVSDIWTYIGGPENNVPANYTENEKLCYLVFLAVARHSAKLWLPQRLGGENAISLIQFPPVNGEDEPAVASRISWWKVITTDAAGALYGVVGSLISTGGASAVPVAGGIPPAGIQGVIKGATASTISIISQLYLT